MSNYPPGVTGMEPAIAGPQSERDEARSVEHACDEEKFDSGFSGIAEGTVIQWDRWSRTFTYDCPQCGEEVDEEDAPDEPEAYED